MMNKTIELLSKQTKKNDVDLFTEVAFWWRARELNPRPLRCERSALPTELAPHLEGTVTRA